MPYENGKNDTGMNNEHLPQIELLALGTASQVPTRKRNHNGYLLRLPEYDILFDPGEGTQLQMAKAGVWGERIRRIFITHFHGDHCLGLAGVFQRINMAEPDHNIDVHFPSSGLKYFDRALSASIYEQSVEFRPHPIQGEGQIVESASLMASSYKLSHGVPTYGYRLEFLWPNQQKFVFAFVMDTRRCPGAEMLAKNADVLVSECTYLASEDKEAVERGHLTAQRAAQLAVDQNVKHLLLTHFSQRYPINRVFYDEAKVIHPNVTTLSDLRWFKLTRTNSV